MVKTVVETKELFRGRDEVAERDIKKFIKKERERLKGVYIKAKKQVNEQFGRKRSQNEVGN